MFWRLIQHLFPGERRTNLIRAKGVHHRKGVCGRFNAIGVEFLHTGSVVQDQPELSLIMGEFLVAQPEPGESRNMSNIDIDRHPLSVGAAHGQIVGTARPR